MTIKYCDLKPGKRQFFSKDDAMFLIEAPFLMMGAMLLKENNWHKLTRPLERMKKSLGLFSTRSVEQAVTRARPAIDCGDDAGAFALRHAAGRTEHHSIESPPDPVSACPRRRVWHQWHRPAAAILKSEGCDFDLSIAGDGVDAGFLKTLTNQHGLQIDLPGWLDSAKRNSFYDGLDIIVCPSRHEPFGIYCWRRCRLELR
jgi:hypothetical protein